jgi:hypothetical protein
MVPSDLTLVDFPATVWNRVPGGVATVSTSVFHALQ